MARDDAGQRAPDRPDPQERTDRALVPSESFLSVAVGRTLGPYRIERLLSTGGMGILYVGWYAESGRRVALKVLHPRFNDQPDFVRRFFDEARAVNKINHPNIVRIEDCVQEPNGLNYLVMELLEGADLMRAREAGRPWELERALRIARETARALGAAHAKRIVHRDVKPENIFLAKPAGGPEVVKLLDFGIAKLLDGGARQTRTGQVMGTPEFMAPEQALGAPVDERADIYAFGAVLHWLLTDRAPFEGAQLAALEARRLGPSPLAARSAAGEPIPAPLRQLVQRCLVFGREQRIASMSEVSQVLERRLTPTPDQSATPEKQPEKQAEPRPDPRRDTQPGFTPVLDPELPTEAAAPPPRAGGRLAFEVTLAVLAICALGWWVGRPEQPQAAVSPPAQIAVPLAAPSAKPPQPAPVPAPAAATSPAPASTPAKVIVRPPAFRELRRHFRSRPQLPPPARDVTELPLDGEAGAPSTPPRNPAEKKPKDPLDSRDGTEEWQ